MAAPLKRENKFDSAKLATMVEPLTVRVERVRGSQKSPIDVPPGSYADGEGPLNTNWTRDQIQGLESWLLTLWSGGGNYHIVVNDSSNPSIVMEWDSVFDTKLFPEKIPPSQASAMSVKNNLAVPPPSVAQTQNPPPPQPFGTTAPSMPDGSSYATPSVPSPMPPPAQTPPMPMPMPSSFYPYAAPSGTFQPPNAGWNSWGNWQGGQPGYSRFTQLDDGRRRHHDDDDDRKRLEADLRRLEREKIETESRSMVERMQNSHAREIESLRRDMQTLLQGGGDREKLERERERLEREREREKLDLRFKELQDAILAVAKRPAEEDGGLRRVLEEQQRRFEDQQRKHLEEIRLLREENQRERERLEAQQREERQRQEMKEVVAKTEALVREAGSSKPDQVFQLMQENARQQAEVTREVARMQQMNTQQLSAMILSPSTLLNIVKDAGSGTQEMLRNVTGVFDFYRNAFEHISSLSGGGSEGTGLQIAREVAGRVGDIANTYIAAQRDAAVSASKAKAMQAQAQAQVAVMGAQAQMQGRQQQQQASLPQFRQSPERSRPEPSPVETPPVAAPVATPVATGNGSGNGKYEMSHPVVLEGAPSVPPPPSVSSKRMPSEEDMFGLATASVADLRIGVERYLEANKGQIVAETERAHEEGKPIGLSPEDTINALIQGINEVTKMKLVIPAFTLFEQRRYADLMDALLPPIRFPQSYRDECVRILTHEVSIEEEDEGEEEEEEAPPQVPPSAPNRRPSSSVSPS